MLLIFDLDGTLFMAKPVIFSALDRLSREYGGAFSVGIAEKYAGHGTDSMIRAVLPHLSIPILSHAKKRYIELLGSEIYTQGVLFPGVPGMLKKLAAHGHMLVVCSNSSTGYIGRVLEHTGISCFFSRYVSTENYGGKIEAVAALSAGIQSAVVIGDTGGDIRAALACGLPSIAALYGYGNKNNLRAATAFANSPDEIFTCICNLI